MCNPLWTFDSYNALTNVVRFKLREQKSDTLDIYNLMFGLKRPCLRLITIGDDNHWDYLEKAGPISLKHTGKKTMLASDLSSADKTFHQWRFTYNIEYLYRKNRKIDGERVFVPEIFECSLSFLNPRRAHKVSQTCLICHQPHVAPLFWSHLLIYLLNFLSLKIRPN